jgi:ADP-heptose:LPS heptosyltransferase
VVAVDDDHALRESWSRLRGERFDAVIDLHGSLRSRLVSYRISARRTSRINKHDRRRREMVKAKKGLDAPLSVVENYLATLPREWKVPRNTEPRLVLSQSETEVSAQLRTELPDAVGVGIGARWATKAVPLELWQDAICKLSGTGYRSVRLFGLRDDQGTLDQLAETIATHDPRLNVIMHVGLSITDILTHLHACRAYMGSDSGLTHIAAALGVPTVSVFGPTHPALGFAPVGRHARVVHAAVWCSPCHKHGAAPCFRERRFCFDELSGADVVSAVDAVTKMDPGNE